MNIIVSALLWCMMIVAADLVVDGQVDPPHYRVMSWLIAFAVTRHFVYGRVRK